MSIWSRPDHIKIDFGGGTVEMRRSGSHEQIEGQTLYQSLSTSESITGDMLDTVQVQLSAAIVSVDGQKRAFTAADLDRMLTVSELLGLYAKWHEESGLGEPKEQTSPG